MNTDLLIWNAQNAIGFGSNAAYPTQEATAERFYVPFDDSTAESCIFNAIMPEGYESGQTLKADIYFYMASATSGNVDFEISLEAITSGDSVDLDAGSSFDDANSNNGAVPATQGYLGKITVTLTNKDSVAVGDMIRLKLSRDADDGTNDTAVGDCNVTNVRLYQSTT